MIPWSSLRRFSPACLPLLAACTQPVVEGRVVNGLDRKPIAGAMVTISGTTLAATTDNDGHYRVRFAPGQFRVVASKDGFFPVSLAFNVTQPALIPAEEMALYPRIEEPGYYVAWQSEFCQLPEQGLASLGNLMQTIAGLKETAELPGLAPAWRVFRHPATGEAVRLSKLEYKDSMPIQGVFGKQNAPVDMWVGESTSELKTALRVEGELEEIPIPATLVPGTYAFGDAGAVRSTVEAAMGGSRRVVAFVFGDPEAEFFHGIDLKTNPPLAHNEVKWSDTDDFKEVARFELGVPPDAFALLCQEEQCGASSCFQQCKVQRVANAKIVLTLSPQSTLHVLSEASAIIEEEFVWRGDQECHACPHHRLIKRHEFDPTHGQFVTRELMTPRRYTSEGPVPNTWNAIMHLDEEGGFRSVRLGSPASALQGLKPVEPAPVGEGCFTRDSDDLHLGPVELDRIAYCFQRGFLSRIEVSPKDSRTSALLAELQSRYGDGFEVQGHGVRRTWPGKRVELQYFQSPDGKNQYALFAPREPVTGP